MDKITLNHALASAQMLSLLVPLTSAYSLASTRVSALRSALDETVTDLVLHPVENALSHTAYVLQVRQALTQYLQETFVLPQLVLDVAQQTYQKKSTSTWLRNKSYATDVCSTSKLQALASKRPAGQQRPAPAAAAYNAKRGTVAKKFASLVRNAPWPELLLEMAPETPELFGIAMLLRRLTASPQGMQAFELRVAELAGSSADGAPVAPARKKTASRKTAAPSVESAAADVALAAQDVVPAVVRLTVALDPSGVIRLPNVRELLVEDTERVLPNSESLDRIMQECCAAEPLELGESVSRSVEDQALLKLKRLLNRLAQRAQLLETEHKRLKKKRDDEALDKARAALKGLGPVLDILRKHPELLKEV